MADEVMDSVVEATPAEDVSVFDDFVGGEVEAPAATPTTSPEGTPPPVAPDSGNVAEAPVAGSPDAAVVPPTAPPVAPAAVPPTAPQVVPTQEQPAAVAPPVQASSEPVQDLGKMREGLVAEIAQRYAMPEQVRDQFLTNPEQVLPVMAARLYVDIYDAVLQTVMTQVPQFMTAREQQVQVARSTEEAFFKRWPSLKDPQYANDIVSVARTYRQQNPKASFEQMIEAIGAMVTVARGVQPPMAQAPAQPSAPQVRPPTPLGSGVVRAAAPVNPQRTIWDELVDE